MFSSNSDVARMSEATSGNERDAGPGFRVRSSGLRFQFSNSRAVLPIHSLPPCGGGLGMGVSRKRRSSRYPPSPTLPRKGERAHRVRRHGNHGFNFQTASFTDTVSRSRRMFARAFWERPAPWRSEGAGNAGRPPRPQPRVRYKNKAHERSHRGHTGFTRHSLRNGFNGFLRALPGDRALLPPSSAESCLPQT